ncbi:ABC transporter substrate-binding protein [Leucobacter sp. M11]|uniref:ABC transporter substrate-binding protein n=1 Tax=Leucobacter sp. M11 TaxID=2993565 RepID=UPI002D80ADC4|nr:ABC transporter substrate-binding protein [Leucobacter sp. M11]MEB4615560.1 ABC transporter substrate-binding protein [Leucobacter sp. M11]
MADQQRGSATVPPAGRPQYEKRSGGKRSLITWLAVLVALAVIGTLIFVLTRPDDGANTGTPGEASGSLTVGLTLEPSNLNVRTTPGVALDQVLIDNVYQGLVGLTPGTLDVVPVLAERYEVSEDGLDYRFELRDGVRFHSGTELNAEDVVTSLTETLGDTITAQAPDERTVTIALEQPNSRLLTLLASREGLILEAGADNDLNTSANGTGPYTLASWKQGDSITLRQSADYWGDPATLDTVVFRYIPDGNAAVNATLSGDVDVQTAVLPELSGQFDGNEDFTLHLVESTDVFTLAYNNQRAPLDDLTVRQALSMAIDQDALIAALNGQGKPLGSPITELEPGYRDLTATNGYDPVRARELLWEAGHEILTLTLTIPNHYPPAVSDLLVSQFAAIGVTLEVDQVEFPSWIEDVHANHNFELSFVDHAEAGDFGNYADPDYYFGYDSARVQELYAQALAATDPAQMDDLLGQAATQVADDAVAKWLYNYTPATAVRSGVEGFPMSNTNARINLAGVTVAE